MKVYRLFSVGRPGYKMWATLTREGSSLTLRWGRRGS